MQRRPQSLICSLDQLRTLTEQPFRGERQGQERECKGQRARLPTFAKALLDECRAHHVAQCEPRERLTRVVMARVRVRRIQGERRRQAEGGIAGGQGG